MLEANELFSEKLVKISLKSETKEEAIKELSEILFQNKKIKNVNNFVKDVLEREKELSTVLEGSIALPHAKSNAVVEASVAVGISKNGINCGSTDGKPTKIFFLIASPENANDMHIKTLSKITSKLLDEDRREALIMAESEKEVYNLLKDDDPKISLYKKSKKFLIGVTGCPVGVAHTYLAANSLKKTASKMGIEIKVETNGSVGVEGSPTEEEINKADAIIVACDKQVDLDRFSGKKVLITGVKEAIDNPENLISKALNGNIPVYYTNNKKKNTSLDDMKTNKTSFYKYLMNGVSYMIPFVVLGGILIALSLAIGGKPTPNGLQIPPDSIWNKILNVGALGFKLMIPILASFIAYAIGDRAAIAPGMIGGWIANDGSFYGAKAGTGFIGAIIAGLVAGYLVKWIKSWKYPKMIQPLVPIMIIPILASLLVSSLFIFVIGAPISSLMDSLVHLLQNLSSGSLIIIGLVIGLMQGFDMGGPFGKVAFMFSVGLIASGQTQFMGAQAVAIPVAPLGMALATFIGRKMNIFDEEEIANGKAALAMGLVGISEGAIPFAASDPLAVIPANMIGSAVACILGFIFGIRDNVAHGGPIVVLLGATNKPLLALLGMFIGAIVTAIVAILLKTYFTKKVNKQKAENVLA